MVQSELSKWDTKTYLNQVIGLRDMGNFKQSDLFVVWEVVDLLNVMW